MLGSSPQQNTSMMPVHPKKGSHLPPRQLALLSRSRTVAGSSPFLKQRVSLSNPISRLTWKHASPDFSLHMEIIKLFLHEKQILYFLKSKNSHCNKHRSWVFRIEEGVTWKYKKQLSLVNRACGQNESLSMTLDSKQTKNWKEVRRRQLRQKKKVSPADWRQSCFLISETFLKLVLTMPGKMPMQDPWEELLMSWSILALCWLRICQRGRSRRGPKQLHTASQGERGVLAAREGTELLKCVVLDCNIGFSERMDRCSWPLTGPPLPTDCPWRRSRDIPSSNDLPIKVMQAEVSRRSHLYSSL